MQAQLDLFHKVSDTSKKAYAEITADGTKSTLRRRVLTEVMEFPGLTRSEIAERLQMRLASVCGRVAELIADGQVLESGTKVDEQTHKTVARLWPFIEEDYAIQSSLRPKIRRAQANLQGSSRKVPESEGRRWAKTQ